MKNKILIAAIVIAALLVSCDSDDYTYSNYINNNGWQNEQTGGFGGESSSTEADINGLTDFDIAFNTESLNETETIPADDNNYVENTSFKGTITITYDGDKATVEGDSDGITSTNGADVTVNTEKAYEFILKGSTTNGSLNVTSEKALAIYLDGVELGNSDGASINIMSKVTSYVVANDGTNNILTDGATRNDDDSKVKGTFFSKGKAIFSGKGKLTINGNFKNGICTKKNLIVRPNTNIYVSLSETIEKGSCLKCENEDSGEGMFIYGGVLNLCNPTAAGKALSADGDITICGGRITAICSGDGLWEDDEVDVSGNAGVKCDSTFTMKGGELNIKSTGNGGKGINGDSKLNFDDGTVRIITTGKAYEYQYNGFTYDTNPKGIKCDGTINVSGGKIYVRATGTSEGSEGIEAKVKYNQTGGEVNIYAADDAMNAGYSSDSIREKQNMGYDMTGIEANKGEINIMGGSLVAYSTSNDGMDSNGYISISGGTIITYGAGIPETSIDCDDNSRLSVTGGTIFGLAGSASNTPGKECSQCFSVCSFSASANTEYTVMAEDGTEIITVTVPRSYNSGALVVSSPKMTKGTKYTVGNTSFTTNSSSWVTNTAGGGMGGGGGRPW